MLQWLSPESDSTKTSAKIDVYKLFVRHLLEYGMQVTLYDSKSIQLFERTQQLALRIAFGLPWNTSKTALNDSPALSQSNQEIIFSTPSFYGSSKIRPIEHSRTLWKARKVSRMNGKSTTCTTTD
jgi:hypothetical protein